MDSKGTTSRFKAALLRPAKPAKGEDWLFVMVPKSASEKLPRRGRTTVEGTINSHSFQVTLEPDGQLSHWLKVDKPLLTATGAGPGDTATFEITAAEHEPEPELPADLQVALAASPEASAVWHETTTIARLDWIHWIVSAKQAKTRAKRISDACDMLASGKRRVCCFDPSGFYSKALRAPEALD